MSETNFLKCACANCGGNIEFPAEGIGRVISCPHCQAKTTLSTPTATTPPVAPATAPAPVPAKAPAPQSIAPKPASTKPPRRTGLLIAVIVVGIVVLSLLAVGVLFVLKMKKSVIPSPVATSSTNTSEPPTPTQIPAQSKNAKSPDDLKVTDITLEKTKGSSLVYVVGNVKNASDHQRFGVKVELNLFDGGNKKVGIATDYIQILEPRKDWRFRALVLDAKAVSAKFSKIKEDE